jgi:hypothetical protein
MSFKKYVAGWWQKLAVLIHEHWCIAMLCARKGLFIVHCYTCNWRWRLHMLLRILFRTHNYVAWLATHFHSKWLFNKQKKKFPIKITNTWIYVWNYWPLRLLSEICEKILQFMNVIYRHELNGLDMDHFNPHLTTHYFVLLLCAHDIERLPLVLSVVNCRMCWNADRYLWKVRSAMTSLVTLKHI